MANYCYWNNKLGIDSSNCEVLTDEFVVWNSNTWVIRDFYDELCTFKNVYKLLIKFSKQLKANKYFEAKICLILRLY